jgi:hypothetical protein
MKFARQILTLETNTDPEGEAIAGIKSNAEHCATSNAPAAGPRKGK